MSCAQLFPIPRQSERHDRLWSDGDGSRREDDWRTSGIAGKRLFGAEASDAYGRVLGDTIVGDATLFAREDYVEEACRIVHPVLKAGTPLYEYEPGTWGPSEVGQKVSPPRGWENPVANASTK